MLQEPPEVPVAQQYVMGECMREAGFDVPLDLRVQPSAHVPTLVGVVGIFESVEAAERYGYESSQYGDPASLTQEFINRLSASDAVEFERVQMGDPEKTASYTLPSGNTAVTPADGCWGLSLEAVYGSATKYLHYSTVRNELSPQLSLNESDFAELSSEYEACMKAAGYVSRSGSRRHSIARA